MSGTLYTLNASATTEAQFFGPWTGGTGTIRAAAGSTGAPLSSGAVAGDGTFGLVLPATIASAHLEPAGSGNIDLSDENCTGSLAVSNPNALGTDVSFTVDSGSSDGEASPVDLRLIYSGSTPVGVTATGGGLLYVNSATTFKGQQTCVVNGSTLTTNIDVALQPGYNSFNVVLTVTASGGTLAISTGAWPSRWVVTDNSALPLAVQKSRNVRSLLERQAERLFPWN